MIQDYINSIDHLHHKADGVQNTLIAVIILVSVIAIVGYVLLKHQITVLGGKVDALNANLSPEIKEWLLCDSKEYNVLINQWSTEGNFVRNSLNGELYYYDRCKPYKHLEEIGK